MALQRPEMKRNPDGDEEDGYDHDHHGWEERRSDVVVQTGLLKETAEVCGRAAAWRCGNWIN